MIERLRNNPWGIRLIAVVAMIVHVPAQLYVERRSIAWAYRIYWQALKTGAQ